MYINKLWSLSKASLRVSNFTSVIPIPLYVPYTDPIGVGVFIRLGVQEEEYIRDRILSKHPHPMQMWANGAIWRILRHCSIFLRIFYFLFLIFLLQRSFLPSQARPRRLLERRRFLAIYEHLTLKRHFHIVYSRSVVCQPSRTSAPRFIRVLPP
ncbi:hypothetical protein F4814DRAFT_164478 [Daldinia grandis]|nr:hypothetical protein F4814DRAFT_164478 [Daldinia grandis]